eukprot:COSAG02_NODE_854_length_16499_cov_76.082561_14_plen_79_part_00
MTGFTLERAGARRYFYSLKKEPTGTVPTIYAQVRLRLTRHNESLCLESLVEVAVDTSSFQFVSDRTCVTQGIRPRMAI